MIFGIDVSHHQAPENLEWEAMARAGCRFCIVRHTNGMSRDRHAPEHVRRARAAGMRVGAYHFFRASQPIEEQFRAFQMARLASSYGQPDDIAPAIDLEDHTDAEKIDSFPDYSTLARKLIDRFLMLTRHPLLYITQRDWGRIGRPDWMLTYPLWVAHYYKPGARVVPATPGDREFAIHQHRVGRFDPEGPTGYYDEPGQIDQNRAIWLPLMSGERLTDDGRAEQPTQPDRVFEAAPDGSLNVLATELAQSSTADLLNADRTRGLSEPEDETTKPDISRDKTDPAPPPAGEDDDGPSTA